MEVKWASSVSLANSQQKKVPSDHLREPSYSPNHCLITTREQEQREAAIPTAGVWTSWPGSLDH
ncbi:hypothetical protein OUZ56_023134 [Daphnia magna]|uniref:Uncharacterized protein n=1 Tax=Daphnia magna TaxID=35525 RepID=A0ABR0AYG6_9CRUS|nr:hypothetical protein OUZ56_023134 [Daphnia magna]